MVKTACFSSRLACVTLDVLRCKAVVSIKNLALHMTALYQYLINGRNETSISPLDRGLAYGDGVFRTLAVRYGHVDHWDRHYHKLEEDCNALGIVCPVAELLLADISRLFTRDEQAVAKIMITRGEGARGYALPVLAQPMRVVVKTALPEYPAENFSKGVNLHLCRLRLAHQPSLAGIKHLNRLENVLARMEWTDATIADGLLLDQSGNVIECTMSNLFARYDRTLLTPDLSMCGVAGITRQHILELAPALGYHARIAHLSLSKLMQADEIVICNSLYGAWQVRELNNQGCAAGDLAERLRQKIQE